MPVLQSVSMGINVAKLIVNQLQKNEVLISSCLDLSANNAPVMIGGKKSVAAILRKFLLCM